MECVLQAFHRWRWIILRRVWMFPLLWAWTNTKFEQTIKLPVIWDATIFLWRHCNFAFCCAHNIFCVSPLLEWPVAIRATCTSWNIHCVQWWHKYLMRRHSTIVYIKSWKAMYNIYWHRLITKRSSPIGWNITAIICLVYMAWKDKPTKSPHNNCVKKKKK